MREKKKGDSPLFQGSLSAPFQEHEVEEYERKRYRGLDQRLVHRRETKILKKILQKVGSTSLRALDVPCGYGRFSDLILDKDFSLVSSDISFSMVKRAREKSSHPDRPLAVIADVKKGLPFKQGVFGLLFSIRFFHHVHEKQERELILEEFSRITSQWTVLSFYRMNFLHFLQRKLRRKVKKSKTRIKMISGKDFENEVERAGYEIVKIYPLFRGIHSHHIALLRKG
ncbi:MAG: methyltransferase domain-containing protein [Candidatus Aminicenantes bacterium]|nr:MAG: methyltransferase domain-containing protein [Candidatus Aminicenantes bacterium]